MLNLASDFHLDLSEDFSFCEYLVNIRVPYTKIIRVGDFVNRLKKVSNLLYYYIYNLKN